MKIFKPALLAAALFGTFTLPAHSATPDQQTVEQISKFGVHYQVTDNQAADRGVDCGALGADWASCSRATITLTNPGAELTSNNWAIYISNVRQVLKVDNEQFKITHLVGDLTRLEPTSKFQGIPAGGSVEIPIILEYWQIFITDVMPRWYVTAGEAAPKIIASTDTDDLTRFVGSFNDRWKRTADDQNVLMQPVSRFEKNSDISAVPAQALRGQITPTPLNLTVHEADADLSSGVALSLPALSEASRAVISQHFARLGVSENSRGYAIKGQVAPKKFSAELAKPGAYQLEITQKGAEIVAYDNDGLFYGVMSILSLLPAEGAPKMATLSASDAPRFAYRGAFLDVARNFHSKEAVMRLLDQMAAWKMNKFHFHLSDDEGWRIEIPGLPELTDIGSKRCHDLTEQRCLLPQLGSGPFSDNTGSGYLTREDYKEILRYASARHITVIPEIDVPAHARAAVVSMEARYQRLMKEGKPEQASEYRLVDPTDTSNTTSVQFYDRTSYLNPCLESSQHFIDKVMNEMQKMHQEAGQPLKIWHFGGDEAKNIRLGTGYSDKNNPQPGTGLLDMSKEDKPWAKSQVCQKLIDSGKVSDMAHLPSYFAQEVSHLIKKHGINSMQAWQDGLKESTGIASFATPHVAVNFWDTVFWGGFDSVNDFASKGFDVIISNPDYLYLDFPSEVNPLERGYYWGTRYNDERRIFGFAPDNLPQNAETSRDRDGKTFSAKSDKPWPGAYGISTQLWSETVRTDADMEFMFYPRLLSVAERAWHRASWELDYQPGREFVGGQTHHVDESARLQDWQRFASLLGQRELAKLDKSGIAWRLPVPGARIADGKLEMNVAMPGLPLEYSLDKGASWQRYSAGNPPQVSGEVQIRTASPDGKRFSRVETL